MEIKNSKDGLTYSFGELLESGGFDVLSGNRVVLWRDGHQQVTSTLAHNGYNYVVAPLEASLAEALRFPAGIEDFGGVESLVDALEQTLGSFVALEDTALLPLAAFILNTWVPECAPTTPLLNVCGPVGLENTLIEVLRSLCRRPLVVSDVSAQDLCALPAGLQPTLLITHPSKRTIQSQLAAAATPQQTLLRRGRLHTCRHATVICTRVPLPAPAYCLRLLPGAEPYRRIPAAELQGITDRLAPMLLGYRLSQHQLVRNSNFDCVDFAPETRLVGRVLGCTLEGSPQLQSRLVAALRAIDEYQKIEDSEQLAALAVEALLVLCNEDAPNAYVAEVTEMVNAILLGRHERLQLTCKKVGAILRTDLGLQAQRRAQGFQITLDSATRQHLERLAVTYSIRTSPKSGVTTDVHNVQDVHDPDDVQEVHNVHDVHNPDDMRNVHNVQDVHDVHGVGKIDECRSDAIGEERP